MSTKKRKKKVFPVLFRTRKVRFTDFLQEMKKLELLQLKLSYVSNDSNLHWPRFASLNLAFVCNTI